jgi:DNA polymerase III epsilon subunit-like protein
MSKKIKRLFIDIETSPNLGIFWRAGFKQTITPDSILQERSIICICYKWAGVKKVEALTWDKRQSDKAMIKSFIKIVNEADEVIAHNGDRYDIPFIRTRCLLHKLRMFPKYPTLDTLKFAKSHFLFNSNRLDYIGKYLGHGGKISTGLDLWKRILLEKDEAALAYMVKYCKRDVEQLEKVFNDFSTHLPARVHHGVLRGKLASSCPDCGSDNMKISKTRISAAGVKRHQMQCNDCGKYHTVSTKTLNKAA